MSNAPILVTCFNRPDLLKKVINGLKINKVKTIYFFIDGPRSTQHKKDVLLIQKNIEIIKKINWTKNVKIQTCKENLGLRFAIPKAVNWVLESNESIIIIEDDVVPQKNFYKQMNLFLDEFKKDKNIIQISGYNPFKDNLTKLTKLNELQFYESNYIESYAWATWRSKWKKIYSDKIDESNIEVYKILKSVVQNRFSKVFWLVEILVTKYEILNSWAYRYLYANWKIKGKVIVPQKCFINYLGNIQGTNVKLKRNKKILNYPNLTYDENLELNFFGGTLPKLFLRIFILIPQIVRSI